MSAIHQTHPWSPTLALPRLHLRPPALPRLRLQVPALQLRSERPRRSQAEAISPVLILVLLLIAGLIWLAVGGAVMRGTR
jgi:hypothetical protein